MTGRVYVALLRAINIGGRTVKMDRLRAIFEEMGLTGVATFIASGNVVFNAPRGSATRLETRIEAALKASLGFHVDTFVRSTAELATISEREFPPVSVYVGFLKQAPDAAAVSALRARSTANDEFDVDDREVYWTCRTSMGLSNISSSMIEKLLGMPMTMRNITTVRKLAAW